MMSCRMMFRQIVGQLVLATSNPINSELIAVDPVLNPIKSHVDGFGSSLFDGVVGNTGSG